ncbi:hypothetical protein [Microbacterium hydrocarbonoxydans]|jgi:hypothetical protein|uniref:hypothetical protein n=1 Tax=Microbacterium hydrocarbonoxydans TaxID=273678 RepID=UPI003D974ADE
MSFFPQDPELPDPEHHEPESPPWWGAPDDELPALLPESRLLATTAHAALAVAGIAVYSTGVEFRMHGRLRRLGLSAREWGELCAVFTGHGPVDSREDFRDRLRYGLELADGERVFADPLFSRHIDPSAPPEGHVLSRRGGGGGGGPKTFTSADELWLWPLPPAGPIDLVLRWPAMGIRERRVTFDGSQIPELAEQARPIWE